MSKTIAARFWPKVRVVCHHCENRRCVRPGHLFLGTALDNTRDMFAKGRANKTRGEGTGRAKLTGRTWGHVQ